MEFLRGVFFLNPLMPALLKQLRVLQELACDEAYQKDSAMAAKLWEVSTQLTIDILKRMQQY